MKALKALWEATPGAQWILSSTWRVRQDYIQDIVEALREFGLMQYIASADDGRRAVGSRRGEMANGEMSCSFLVECVERLPPFVSPTSVLLACG